MPDYKYLGRSLRRDRDRDKLTGRSLYAADIQMPGMLFGALLHSPHAHARILKIDVSPALRIPGVKAVVTAADTPGVKIGRHFADRPVLAQGEVRYMGEPVAAVAALDQETAEEALEAIAVTYEELPAVFDAEEAMQPGAPPVHGADDRASEKRDERSGNVILEAVVRQGDAEEGLARSDVVYEAAYGTPPVHQGFLEPHAVTAFLDGQGKATIWSSTKAPFIVRRMTAKALGLPLTKIRVIAPTLGGDFGGKGTAYMEPVALLLARKAGCPVRLVLSRREELTATFVRDASRTELIMGAAKDGSLLALKGSIILDTGAYCDLGGSLQSTLYYLVGPYRVPHIELKAYRVYTNNIPRGNVRAPSAPCANFAIESHLDGMAARLGIDPIEVRMKNGFEVGDALPGGGAVFTSIGLKQTLAAAADYLKRERGPREKNRGWGVACSQWGLHRVDTKSGPTSSAWVKINEDGTVVLLTGATENGGGQHGVFAQIVAEILGVAPEAVAVVASDTDCTPFEQGTGASRTTYRVGTSVRVAAENAREKLLALAGEKLGVPAAALGMEEGRVFVKNTPERALKLGELAQASLSARLGPIVGVGERGRAEMLAGQAKAENTIDCGTHGAHAVQVEVDPETGKVKVLKYFAAHDVGFAIHPDNVRGQIEGGVVYGMGYGLSEELILKEGEVQNPDWLDYKQPVITDAPFVESAIVESPSRFGAFGVKGVGEPPAIPAAPALANAVFDALGARITELPLTPEKILRALGEIEKGK